MGFITGKGVINIRREEALKLILDGQKAQATIDDSEIAYLEDMTNHSSFSPTRHFFQCLMSRNGLRPFHTTVNILFASEGFFIGQYEYGHEPDNISE